MKIILRKGESIQEAVRRFRKLTKGILQELRRREYYQKPSERRRK